MHPRRDLRIVPAITAVIPAGNLSRYESRLGPRDDDQLVLQTISAGQNCLQLNHHIL